MTNKFNINELVILQSQSSPTKNGEYYVSDLKLVPACRVGETNTILQNVYIYELDGVESESGWWLETALRKKHEGSDFSFTELVNHLQTKIVEKI